MRARVLSILLAQFLLSLASPANAQALDPRADAIDRILPGQGVRVHATDQAFEGKFVTNRSDSLLLRRAAERVSISYSEIHRLDVLRSARAHGLVIGMIVGGLALGVAGAAESASTAVLAATSGLFIGGFLGGAVGGAMSEWHRVYETPALEDSLSSPKHR